MLYWESIFAPAKNEGRHQNFEPNEAPKKFENWTRIFGKIQLIFGGGSRGVRFPIGKRRATKIFTKSATKILNEVRREKIRKMELVWPEKFGKTGTSF